MDSFELRDLLTEIDDLRLAMGALEKKVCTLRASAVLKLGPLIAEVSPVPAAMVEATEEKE